MSDTDQLVSWMTCCFFPLTSVFLAFGLAWYFARQARVRAPGKLPENFELLEKEASRLREQIKRGEITEQDYKTQMLEKMTQNKDGSWWVVGKETGSWYRHNGKDWIKDSPPLLRAEVTSSMAGKFWVAGVIMTGLHIVIIIAYVISALISAVFSNNDVVFTIGFIILYLIFASLIFFIARGLWTSKRGDGIVLGFVLTLGIAVSVSQTGLTSLVSALVTILLLVIGIVLTMALTHKVWSEP